MQFPHNEPAVRVTALGSHHLVGFHDVDPWSSCGTQLLCIRVNEMTSTPTPNTMAEIGYVNIYTDTFHVVGRTSGWNFPQAGRQQWIRNTSGDSIIFNIRDRDHWRSTTVDKNGNTIAVYEKPVYAVSGDSRTSFGLNFSRIYRLGGYGYQGVTDETAGQALPKDDGIWETDLVKGTSRLLVSIESVAHTPGVTSVSKDTEHYLTHIVESPDGKKIAFLHRFWLPDGGIQTRLMTYDLRNQSLEVLAEGFLSHFDWSDTETIMIWGKGSARLQALRNSGALSKSPLLSQLLSAIKPMARRILRSQVTDNAYYRRVSQSNKFSTERFSENIPTTDGHPSFCPANRKLLLLDTYPDPMGIRPLLIYDQGKDKLHEIGRYEQNKSTPDRKNLEISKQYIAPFVLAKLSDEQFAYARSGIHCDLHPRWRRDGKYISFDSNHEGSRQVYVVDTSKILQA